jgi:hypothetical protein
VGPGRSSVYSVPAHLSGCAARDRDGTADLESTTSAALAALEAVPTKWELTNLSQTKGNEPTGWCVGFNVQASEEEDNVWCHKFS